MTSDTDLFASLRPRLFGIAYRMLGARGDAEDLVQDAYLRWHAVDTGTLESPEAWLVTVVTRLSIDRLRALKAERASYFGIWLPEPLVESADSAPSSESTLAFYDDLSTAFLLMLERLGPEERAAFLLREVFDHDYPDIAALLDKSEAACRQLVSRARERVRRDQPRFEVSAQAHRQLIERFAAAARSGAREPLMALLADNVQLLGDGGGVVPSFGKVLHGALRIANLYHVVTRQPASQPHYELATINGRLGLLRWMDGVLESAQSLDTDGERIHAIYVVRNPHKLRDIAAQRGHETRS